ncbi:MAG: alpha/beta fold hydrolase [Oligoflexales bacterium]|nr:alpha/beta fold hydrolase [Oligoflexales bacterium]
MKSRTGFLEVGDGHEIYWEDWGEPTDKTPIFHLHGGPGSRFDTSHKQLYDPKIHRVIFHDQRGCGKSLSKKMLHRNTTQHLIADIESLRKLLGFDSICLSGGSWGSTLGLLYAISFPRQVEKMLLWSVWLARRSEEWAAGEASRPLYRPEEYERFRSFIPEPYQSDSQSVLEYVSNRVNQPDLNTAFTYAYELVR